MEDIMKKLLYLLFLLVFVGCSSSSSSSSDSTDSSTNDPDIVQTYTLTNAEEALFNSISGQEVGDVNKAFDTDGEETSVFFQQTVDINSLQVGDSATFKLNTLNSLITNTDGATVSMNSLNTSTLTASDIVGIEGNSSGLIIGSATEFESEYEDTTQTYSIYVSSNDSIVEDLDLSITFPDGTTFLASFNGNKLAQNDYHATSHDNVPCNQENSYTYILYTTESVPVSTTQDTKSGYAELIMYDINNGDESYLKACI
jgi:hypothetical protein